jgi:fucose 4-O-acetylase-like acetyltransferase
MATPLVRATPLLGALPDPVEWYLRPSPGRTNFTLFPWAGFVFAGSVAGVALAAPVTKVWRTHAALTAAAVLTAAAGYGASFLPSIYSSSEFWTSSPTFFFLRAGLILLLIPLAFAWDAAPWRGAISRWSPVEELGRASLFVYWIHVEMVYGVFSRPLRRALPLETAIVADVLFSLFLLVLVLLRNRLFRLRRPSRFPHPNPTAATI